MKVFLYPSRIKYSNLGDVLINSLLIRELSNHSKVIFDGKTSQINDYILNNNPNKSNIILSKNKNKFNAYPIIRWFRLWKYLHQLNYVLDPPGAYVQNVGIKNKLKNVKYLTRSYLLKKIFNIEVLRWGISMKLLNTKTNTSFNNYKYYKDIALRDSNNFTELKKLGFKNISQIEDLAFLYERRYFLNDEDQKFDFQNNPYTVLSFRGALEGNGFNQVYLDSIFNRVENVLEITKTKDLQLVVSYQVEEDYCSSKYLYTKFKEFGYKCILINEQLDFEKAISLYSKALLLFSNRLHVSLLGLLNNTPSIVISDIEEHFKLINIYKDLELEDLIVDCYGRNEMKITSSDFSEYLIRFSIKKAEKQKNIKNHILKVID